MTAQVTPTLGEFIELAKQGNVIPVFAEFIADGETPVSAFKKLDCGGYSFLFESTEKNDVSGRFSFVGGDPRLILQSYGREIRIIEDGNERRLETSSDPLDEVRKLMARYKFVPHPELPRFNFSREEFERAVTRAKEYIAAGDVFQVVLSQRFEAPFDGEPLEFYRCLRFINPSPYMFCLNFGADFSLVGSSPEMHVRLDGDTVEIRPIAGTRARGLTPEEDEANAAQLLGDPKERAEHIMLVDLARNDVGRVAEFGSVRVTEFMQIERYSHVMHIVSNVVGHLRAGCSAFDAVRSTFPAGTVSGAPKIRAMQIISELEKTRRGCYAGAIGYFGFNGNVDSCIALRCAVLKSGQAYFQAGAGIVSDSNPQREYEETVIKARAMMKALAMASQLKAR